VPITKGVLYEFAPRPAWGYAMMIRRLDSGMLEMRFTDDRVRVLAGDKLREVELAPDLPDDPSEPVAASTVALMQPRAPKPAAKVRPKPKPREIGDEWTAREDALLRKHWTTHTDQQLHEKHLPKRTREAIRRHRYELKLERHAVDVWTTAEVADVVASTETDAVIAAKLGRTLHAVRSCRSRQKVARRPKPSDWTEADELAFNLAAETRTPDAVLAEQLGRTVHAVRLHRHRLKKIAQSKGA
jgi:hypothetical protein